MSKFVWYWVNIHYYYDKDDLIETKARAFGHNWNIFYSVFLFHIFLLKIEIKFCYLKNVLFPFRHSLRKDMEFKVSTF